MSIAVEKARQTRRMGMMEEVARDLLAENQRLRSENQRLRMAQPYLGVTSQGGAHEQFALDSLVKDAYGWVGRVWSVYRNFEATGEYQRGVGQQWLDAQSKPFTDAQQGEIWYTVRPLDGGSVLSCHSRLTPMANAEGGDA